MYSHEFETECEGTQWYDRMSNHSDHLPLQTRKLQRMKLLNIHVLFFSTAALF